MKSQTKMLTVPILMVGLMPILISALNPPEPVKQLLLWRILCGIGFFGYATFWSAWVCAPSVTVTWVRDKK